jgi:crossover junction endodeoxyribonuclease RuvC
MKEVIGVDPGLAGALVAITPDGLDLRVMPVVAAGGKHQYDEHVLVEWLTPYAIKRAHVFIEAVHAMPKQGVASMFTFGAGYGLLRGICSGLGLSYELVRPQEWQRAMLLGQPTGSEYLVASRLWPNAEWCASERCRKPHGGLVDAALIAEFGRRKLGMGSCS